MAFVFSPSNMMTYMTCPKKFWAQSIAEPRLIKWKASKEKSRGSIIHTDIQKSITHGLQTVRSWQEGVDFSYITRKVNTSRQVIADGGCSFIEKELCINSAYKSVDWWNEDGLLRAKADVILLPKDTDTVDIIDIKSGKKWDEIDFQLRVEALLGHIVFSRPVVNYEYWYVDTGETVDGSIDFRNGLAPVQDVINLIKEMRQAIANVYFPPKANNFCKWKTGKCDLYKTPECGL